MKRCSRSSSPGTTRASSNAAWRCNTVKVKSAYPALTARILGRAPVSRTPDNRHTQYPLGHCKLPLPTLPRVISRAHGGFVVFFFQCTQSIDRVSSVFCCSTTAQFFGRLPFRFGAETFGFPKKTFFFFRCSENIFRARPVVSRVSRRYVRVGRPVTATASLSPATASCRTTPGRPLTTTAVQRL